jgi:hypothetical protein
MDIHPPDPAAWRMRYDQIVESLRAGLPPPAGIPPGQTGPEFDAACEERDRYAFDSVAILEPADADEAMLAVQYVIATEYMCFGSRRGPKPLTRKQEIKGRQLLRQHVREAQRTRSELLARQVARREREAAGRARQAVAQAAPAQGTGAGLVARGGVAAAPALLPPLPRGEAQPPPRARPVLRLIRGGLAE